MPHGSTTVTPTSRGATLQGRHQRPCCVDYQFWGREPRGGAGTLVPYCRGGSALCDLPGEEGDVMGKEARIGLLLGACCCLLAVMVDWVVEELHEEVH